MVLEQKNIQTEIEKTHSVIKKLAQKNIALLEK